MEATMQPSVDEAVRLLHDGSPAEAAEQCIAVLRRQPGNPAAHTLLGTAQLILEAPDQAAASFQAAIAADPQSFEAHRGRAVALASLGQADAAVESIHRALLLRPDAAVAHYDLGVLLLDLGRFDEAIQRLQRAIELNPQMAEAQFNLGVALGENGDHEAAIAAYRGVLELMPELVEANYNLGLELSKLNRHAMAIVNFQKVVDEKPEMAQAHLNLGVALRCSGYVEPAIDAYRRALEIDPGYAAAHSNLGIALESQSKLDEAITCYRQAIAADPDYPEAWFNLGTALSTRGRDKLACEALLKAVTLDPYYVDALRNLASVQARLGQYRQANDNLQKVATLREPDAGVLAEIGNVLLKLDATQQAIAAFKQALDLDPKHVAALRGLGLAYQQARDYENALNAAEAALIAAPADTGVVDSYVDVCRHVCEWKNIAATSRQLTQIVAAGGEGISAFRFLAVVDDPALHLAAGRQHWKGRTLPAALPAARRRAGGGKLRIGYFSGDFNQHATAYLIMELFEQHDKSQFEIVALSHGPDDEGAMRARIVSAVDQMIDVHGESDEQVAQRIRDAGIDVLVELDGLTRRNRLPVLAARPAPVQVHYMGYPGSTGADFLHYILVDSFIAPPGADAHFVEKLVRLPDCYQVSDRKRGFAEPMPTRAACGLPESGFVFCSFNNSYKITPEIFDIWMRLLLATPGSVLWLLGNIPLARVKLRAEAAARGVDPERLVFADYAATDVHLARHRHADLSLDTLPYNAHTTANDSLWAGVPILTCAGRAFPARVAGSLLHAVGLPELVTTDLAAYEAKALALAHDPAALGALRRRLAQNIPTAPLFDTARAARAFESAYRQMFEIHQRGEAPRAITVT